MERLGERDRVLLGYAYRDPFGNLQQPPPPPPHHRNSDVDFADVFGGPPRRSSFYERRRSLADSLDSQSRSRPLSSGLADEKPVFGELGSPARRRHFGDNFYEDIFPGSDSGSSTSRKLDRDPFFPSAPGSRVLSPNRPVLVGDSSLPPQLSLPKMRFMKGVDHPPFSSPAHHAPYKSEDGDPYASTFPYSPSDSQATPAPDDMRNVGHAFYCQSPLATQTSRGMGRSSEAFSRGSQSERYATSLEGYIGSNNFHFSLYKWAAKGVSLTLSSHSKKTNDVGRCSRLPEVVIQADDLPSDDDDMSTSTSTGVSNNQTETHDNKVLSDAGSTITEDVLPESHSKHLSRTFTGNSGMISDNIKEFSVAIPDTKRPELKNLHHLFKDDFEKDGHESLAEKAGGGQRDMNDDFNAKQQVQGQNSEEHLDAVSPRIKDIPVSLEDKMHGSKVRGRVKEFIKIFNLEGSPKRKGTFESGDRKSKEKDRVKNKLEVQASVSAAKTDEEMKPAPTTEEGGFIIDSSEVNETSKKGEIPDFYPSSNVPLSGDPSSERKNTLEPSSDSTQESIVTPVYNVKESHLVYFDGCLVEQLCQEHMENKQTLSHQDQIKIADAKIREWSKGKEGNIRSLLSTLQYVLWKECGWKPVPLVDIIEGTSVKRAYQKALLCLHPDKLQQRGVAEHQKYIAEKVFDILQEAWDQFNSATNVF
uniref:J domain-containing protein required for chloroplast accumulation response 1 n=1 Tax=Musa acuminata subsp. malaccensis TaxID=214687 RepID=A0A804K0J0_MUSAM|nr:PREDICTED: J domain-containing protein required for chloroplast accumulation response 1 [Musa acuminata subsp. malaccensis]